MAPKQHDKIIKYIYCTHPNIPFRKANKCLIDDYRHINELYLHDQFIIHQKIYTAILVGKKMQVIKCNLCALFGIVFKSISCGSELDVHVFGKSVKKSVWYKVTVDCF